MQKHAALGALLKKQQRPPTFCATRTSKKVTKTRPVTEPEDMHKVCSNGPCFSQTEAPKLNGLSSHSCELKEKNQPKNIKLIKPSLEPSWNASQSHWQPGCWVVEAVAQGSIQPSHITKPGPTGWGSVGRTQEKSRNTREGPCKQRSCFFQSPETSQNLNGN